MAADNVLHLSAARKPSRLKQAVVVGIAIAALAYGMVIHGAHPPSAAPAPAAAEGVRAATESRNEPRAVDDQGRPAEAEDWIQRESEPRACAQDRGITEACTYN